MNFYRFTVTSFPLRRDLAKKQRERKNKIRFTREVFREIKDLWANRLLAFFAPNVDDFLAMNNRLRNLLVHRITSA